MQNLSGNSLDKFNKSCSALRLESSKIEFVFFRFFYDFLGILQDSAIHMYYWRFSFPKGSLDRFWSSHIYPRFVEKTLGRNCPLKLGHWAPAGGGPANSGAATPGYGRRKVGRRVGAHLRPFCGRRQERGSAGGLGRRCWVAPAVAAWSPAGRRRFPGNAQGLEL
jgi:hypothetical protein